MHQHLMRAYHALGRRAEALATYRRCWKTLATVLKLAPSPATEALYKALQASQFPAP